MTEQNFDSIISGGTVIDPVSERHGRFDVGIRNGRIAAVEPSLADAPRHNSFDATDRVVIPGMIDTHAHVYQHVTGKFGLNADLVGVGSAATTLVDQGGPSCMTIGGFRHFVAEPSHSRVLCFISGYLVGGLEGHMYPDLYSPSGVNVDHTVRAIEENRDIVKGIKAHAEIGGASRWGLDVIKLTKEIARRAELPLYIHLGQLWPHKENSVPDPDELVRELVPILDEGDILAHPFTRHPGGFVSTETGEIHPIIWEALDRGVTVDVGHGSHFSFDMARRAIEAGIRPYTLGADLHGYNVHVPQAGIEDSERARNPFFGVAPFNLTIAMTELLCLGMSLEEVIPTVTSNPARMLAMDAEIGSLALDRKADISILELKRGPYVLTDNSKEKVQTDVLVHPVACFVNGEHFAADSPLVPPPSVLAA